MIIHMHADDFKLTLENYVSDVLSGVPVKVLRSEGEQLGLIRARLWGIREAEGDVIVCMDSHMEVQKLW